MRLHRHIMRHITDWVDEIESKTFSILKATTAKFGTPPNYTEFESDGTMEMHGTATPWDDLRFEASRQRSKGSPTYQSYKGGQVLSLANNVDQGIYFNAQTTHSRKLGSDLTAHYHYTLPVAGAGAGAENIKFDLTYSWAPGNAASNYSDWPTETTISATLDVQNMSADQHLIAPIGTLTNPANGENISDMLICSFTRDTSVANNYASPVYLLEIDFHYEIDTIGSREAFTK